MRRTHLVGLLFVGNALVYAACGGDTAQNDAGTDSSTNKDVLTIDSATDAAADVIVDSPADSGPACNPSNPFSTPTILGSLDVQADVGNTRGAHFSSDYLTAYFEYGSSLYSGTRAGPTGDTFGSLTLLSSVSGGDVGADASPTVSSDGLTIYFGSTRAGASAIYFATRTSKSNAFGAPALVTGMPAGAATSPFLQGDGSTLYFQIANDFYHASVTGAGVVSSPAILTEFSADGGPSNGGIVVTADGLRAYASRVLAADGGPAAHFKIWTATRASTSSPFSSISPVPELNGPDGVNDDITWVSNDGCQVMLSSFRAGGSQIFIANK